MRIEKIVLEGFKTYSKRTGTNESSVAFFPPLSFFRFLGSLRCPKEHPNATSVPPAKLWCFEWSREGLQNLNALFARAPPLGGFCNAFSGRVACDVVERASTMALALRHCWQGPQVPCFFWRRVFFFLCFLLSLLGRASRDWTVRP